MAVSFLLLLLFLTSSSVNTQPLLLRLTHTLSLLPPSNSSQQPHHLLSSLRSAARFRSRRHRQLPLPLSAGSDYTLSLSIASATVSLYLDTGSDLLWFPCSPFQCILCEGKPFFPPSSSPPPSSSLRISCSSPLCSAAHSSLPTPDLCSAARCSLDSIETSSCSSPCPQLYYAYADGSILAHLRRAPLSLPNLPSLPNFTFACAHSSLAEPLGVAGFGRGPLSLPNQLALHSPSLASRFSYCLISHSFLPSRLRRPSPLILGRSPSPSFSYTPLLSNPSHQYLYSVALLSLSVASVRVPASPSLAAVDRAGFGGMAIDSGTTFTMLPAATHRRLAAEFARQMERNGFRRATAAEERTGLGPCYAYGSGREEARRVPAVGMHFAGNASVWLPTRNYFMGFESEGERVGCFMVMSAGDDKDGDGGPAGTLGNFQQQGMEVLYDLEMGRVGFARRRCAALWDSVTRG